jgi:hypothetical protein
MTGTGAEPSLMGASDRLLRPDCCRSNRPTAAGGLQPGNLTLSGRSPPCPQLRRMALCRPSTTSHDGLNLTRCRRSPMASGASINGSKLSLDAPCRHQRDVTARRRVSPHAKNQHRATSSKRRPNMTAVTRPASRKPRFHIVFNTKHRQRRR